MIFGKYINKYYKKYWYFFLLTILCDILVDVIQLYLPKLEGFILKGLNNAPEDFMGQGITSLTIGGVYTPFPFYAKSFTASMISLAVITIIIVLGRIGWRTFSARIGAHIEHDLRAEMYQNIQKMSLSYYSEKKVGGLMSYLTGDIQQVKQLFIEGYIFLTDLLVLGSLSFLYMLQYSWLLGLLCMLPLLFFIFFGKLIGDGMTKRSKEADDSFERLSDFTEENLQGFSVIKAFSKERVKEEGFEEKAKDTEKTNIRLANYNAGLDVTINLIITFMYAILLLCGAYSLLVSNDLFLGNIRDTGDFVAFAGYCDSLIWPMMAGGILLSEVSNAKAAYKRMETILSAKEDIVDAPDAIPHDHIEGHFVVSHLSFSYPGSDEKVLDDISFEIKPGSKVGILGRTGSGKSTLVSLFPKLYEVPQGMISLDGDDLSKWRKEDLRNHIGFVSQRAYLFSGPIKESIGFSEEDSKNIDEEKMKKAAHFAAIDKDIESFPDGYDTIVGEKGNTLSGGQKQRISIARAIYKNPDVLILDDSLSAVDADTEKNILSNLKTERKDVTSFLICHRISSLENCDVILVLDKGKLVGFGSHEELLKSCSLYQDIYALQQLEKEVA